MALRRMFLAATLAGGLLLAPACEAVLSVDQFPRPEPPVAGPDAGACQPCNQLPCGYPGCDGVCQPGSGCKPAMHRVQDMTVSPLAGEAKSERTAGAGVRSTAAAGDLEPSSGNTAIHGLVVSP